MRRSLAAAALLLLPQIGARAAEPPSREDYARLFRYFVGGFEARRSPAGARAYFPGRPSSHGRDVDALEGFSRSAPLWAAWVSSGRPGAIRLADGRLVRLDEEFRRGLLAGTDPKSPEYWGGIGDLDQRIVEASDVALSLWLLRRQVWARLDARQKARVAAWLGQVDGKAVHDNNWHLFPVFIDAVLRSLDAPRDEARARLHYDRFKRFYRGGGWFSDGPGEVFDFYNAWGIHYQLYWLSRVAPDWDAAFIARARREFLSSYRLLIGPAGVPILGRSVCYRLAASAPLILGQGSRPGEVPPSTARRALDATWSYFIARGALRDGNVTQGYCAGDPRVLDDYSGPASCLWSTRSLVAAFSFPESSPFWTQPPGRLPVEEGDYALSVPEIGWTIVGERASGSVRILKAGAPAWLGTARRWLAAAAPRSRLGLWRAQYGLGEYGSAAPYCGCALPDGRQRSGEPLREIVRHLQRLEQRVLGEVLAGPPRRPAGLARRGDDAHVGVGEIAPEDDARAPHVVAGGDDQDLVARVAQRAAQSGGLLGGAVHVLPVEMDPLRRDSALDQEGPVDLGLGGQGHAGVRDGQVRGRAFGPAEPDLRSVLLGIEPRRVQRARVGARQDDDPVGRRRSVRAVDPPGQSAEEGDRRTDEGQQRDRRVSGEAASHGRIIRNA